MSKYEKLDELILTKIGATPEPVQSSPVSPVHFNVLRTDTPISAESERLA